MFHSGEQHMDEVLIVERAQGHIVLCEKERAQVLCEPP